LGILGKIFEQSNITLFPHHTEFGCRQELVQFLYNHLYGLIAQCGALQIFGPTIPTIRVFEVVFFEHS
jgi:hypothetical protein